MPESEPHIEFIYEGDGEPSNEIKPQSASEVIPEWFRRTPAIFDPGSKTGTTVKLCRAFTDALHMGFIIPAPEDIRIDRFRDYTIGSDSDNVHVYGPSPVREDGNSMYPVPEVKIENPWRIKTPEGYSALVTKPLNRTYRGFEPNTMLVPTDSYEGPINIPAVMGPKPIEIEKGDPFVHVIPFKREEVLNHENVCTSEVPELLERCKRVRRQLDSRKDLYRKVYHNEKPTSKVHDAAEADFDRLGEEHSDNGEPVDQLAELGKRSETHDEHFLYLTKEENYGITPGPYDAAERAPPWIGELADNLEASPGSDGSDEDRFDDWIEAACSMGTVDVTISQFQVNQEGGYKERTIQTPYDRSVAKHSIDEKIGPEFPFPFKIAGVSSDRYVLGADGYSTLVTDPFNHFAQHFRSFHGVVDHDVYYDVSNVPSMIFNRNPEFTIDYDEPMVQFVTFRRDSIISNGVVSW